MNAPLTTGTVTVVLVTFQSERIIGQAVKAVDRDPAVERIIVVDNASDDQSTLTAQAASPRVEVIRNAENVGFGNGMNIGLDLASTPFSLVLNPDARFPDKGITRLVEVALSHPNAAIVGPWFQKRNQPASRLRTGPIWNKTYASFIAQTDQQVGFISGAAMLLRNEFFSTMDHFFDPQIFMFSEDDEIGARCLNSGHELILTSHVVIDHDAGTSSRPDPRIDELRHRHFAWSRLYVERKFFGKTAATALARTWKRTCWAKYAYHRLTRNSAQANRQRAYLLAIDDMLHDRMPSRRLSDYGNTTSATTLRAA